MRRPMRSTDRRLSATIWPWACLCPWCPSHTWWIWQCFPLSHISISLFCLFTCLLLRSPLWVSLCAPTRTVSMLSRSRRAADPGCSPPISCAADSVVRFFLLFFSRVFLACGGLFSAATRQLDVSVWWTRRRRERCARREKKWTAHSPLSHRAVWQRPPPGDARSDVAGARSGSAGGARCRVAFLRSDPASNQTASHAAGKRLNASDEMRSAGCGSTQDSNQHWRPAWTFL